MPSRGSGLAVAAARTTLSPKRTTADPPACLASFPVSKEIFLPPARSMVISVASGFIVVSFWIVHGRVRGREGGWKTDPQGLKPGMSRNVYGTTEVVPVPFLSQNANRIASFLSVPG